MAENFESIFSASTENTEKVNKLFTRKARKLKLKDDLPDIDEEEIKKSDQQQIKKSKKLDPEQEKRTIFVGNLPTDCKKEELTKIFKSYGKIEAVRFRNIVPEDITKPKKFAYITKTQHPNKQSINGFIRFKDEDSAINAAKEINGMEFKTRHLRVDVATKSKVHNNKCSVFLGALAFDVTDEAVYEHFAKCGEIDNVRIIRDNKTGVGKGFGYVQFKTADTIDLALKLDASKMGERKIRVSRAVKKLKEKKTEPMQNGRGAKGKDRKGAPNNKFQAHSDKNKKSDDQTLSRLGKVKHAKRKAAQEAGQIPAKVEKPKKAFNTKNLRVSRRKKNEQTRKKLKKKHVGTNNKNATRFNI